MEMLYAYGHLPLIKIYLTEKNNVLQKEIQNVYIWSPLS